MRRNLFLLIVVLAATSTLTLAAPKGVAQSPESPQNNAVGVVSATVSATSDHSSASDEVTVGAGRRVFLSGSADAVGEGASYKWEIADGPYDWLTITEDASRSDNSATPQASFLLPQQNYVDGVTGSDAQKYQIRVTLNVTVGTVVSSDTVTVNIARPVTPQPTPPPQPTPSSTPPPQPAPSPAPNPQPAPLPTDDTHGRQIAELEQQISAQETQIATLEQLIASQTSHIATQASLIAAQEALLNAYRCLYNVDTQIVPGGCPSVISS